jgi:flagellar basal body-associated protein FliL
MDGYRVEDKEPWLTSDRKRNLLGLILPAGVFGVLMLVTSEEKALALTITAFVLGAVVVTTDHQREAWFWVTIIIMAVTHIAAIFLYRFTLPSGPALAYVAPATFADGFAMFGIVDLLASRFSAKKNKRSG